MECRCTTDFGELTLFFGCEWTLLESNCPSLSFSLASDSANFDQSFNGLVSIENNSEIESSVEDTLEDLQQQLQQVKEQFQYQVVTGKIKFSCSCKNVEKY